VPAAATASSQLQYCAAVSTRIILYNGSYNGSYSDDRNCVTQCTSACSTHSAKNTDLVEANVVSVQPEALPAHVDGVLPDDTVLVRADTALAAALALLLWVRVC
jgi:hypothetical protein